MEEMDVARILKAVQLCSPGFWEHQARLARTVAVIEALTATTDRLVRTLTRLPGETR